MLKQSLIALSFTLILLGCSRERMTRVSSDNPASPAATEAPVPQSQGIAPGLSGQAPTETTISSTQQNQKVVYTCPMHPQILRDKPGSCPICGMTLVPKK